MDPFLGVVVLMAIGYMMRGAVTRARDDYRRSQAEHLAAAQRRIAPRTLTPPARRQARARHRTGWWAAEVRHGFPVTRIGMHTGWLAHQAATRAAHPERVCAGSSPAEQADVRCFLLRRTTGAEAQA
jgi:hypothetical protein